MIVFIASNKKDAHICLLKLRIYAMTFFNEDKPYNGDTVPKLIKLGNNRLTARSVKFFADGRLG